MYDSKKFTMKDVYKSTKLKPPGNDVNSIVSNASSSSNVQPPAIASTPAIVSNASSSSSNVQPPAIASNAPPLPPPVQKKTMPKFKAPTNLSLAEQIVWLANAKKLWREEEDARVAKEEAEQTELYKQELEKWNQE
jgi:hypothetical protein